MLDLVEGVEIEMRGHDERKITIRTDCRKVWNFFAADGLKESQLEGHGGSIVSRII